MLILYELSSTRHYGRLGSIINVSEVEWFKPKWSLVRLVSLMKISGSSNNISYAVTTEFFGDQ